MADRGRFLYLKPSLYMPMLPGETKEQAEDRMLELLDSVGIEAVGWNEDEVEMHEPEKLGIEPEESVW